MIKFLKKIFGRKKIEEVKSKPLHCDVHKRFIKNCSSCKTIVERGYR